MVAVQDTEYQTLGTLSCLMCFVWRSVMGRSRPNLAAPCGLGSCRISPPRFLAECGRSPLNQGSFVLLYFVLFNFSGLYLVTADNLKWQMTGYSCLLSILWRSYTTWMTLYSLECADVSLRICSLSLSLSLSDQTWQQYSRYFDCWWPQNTQSIFVWNYMCILFIGFHC